MRRVRLASTALLGAGLALGSSEAGAQALPLFNGSLRETIEEFDRLGIGIDEGVLKPVERARTRLDTLGAVAEDAVNRIKAAFTSLLGGALPEPAPLSALLGPERDSS